MVSLKTEDEQNKLQEQEFILSYVLNEAEIKEMIKRKEDHISGKITSKPWSEIEKRYSKIRNSK